MEKTNKCSVQYICHGYLTTCKFALKPVETNYCYYFADGHCTCEEAQKEAVSDED